VKFAILVDVLGPSLIEEAKNWSLALQLHNASRLTRICLVELTSVTFNSGNWLRVAPVSQKVKVYENWAKIIYDRVEVTEKSV